MPPYPDKNLKGVGLESASNIAQAGGKSWFLGIGINYYKEFKNLNNAVKDVQDLVKLLQEEYDLVPEYTLTLYNEQATRKSIIRTLDRLERNIGPNDKLIIYYSGHGHLNKHNGKGYWIPTDAERDNSAEYIRNSTIREYIETLKSLHTLLISDACFSGSLFVRGGNRSTKALTELASLPSRWAICSGRHDEEVYDGEPGGNSPFAASIIDTLRRNSKKEFNVAKLIDRVVEQTRSNYRQLPEGKPLFGVGDMGGQYIFWRRAVEAEDWAAAKAAAALPLYRQYLENHPNGRHAAEAREAIAFLAEEAAWEEARRGNTSGDYLLYRRKYPAGRYREQALEAIRELEEGETWQLALRRNTLFDYERYLEKYPNGKYRKDAEEALDGMLQKRSNSQRRQAVAIPATGSRFHSEQKEKPGVNSQLKKWLPMAGVVLTLIMLIGWGIGKIAGSSVEKQTTQTLDAFERNGKYGYRDEQGLEKIAAQFDVAEAFSNGEARVTQDGQTFTIDENGNCVADCPEEKDKAAWAKAEHLDDIYAYRSYQKSYPRGKYYEQAQKRIDELDNQLRNEYQFWQNAASKNTIVSYKAYQNAYPKGKYYQEATTKIRALEKRVVVPPPPNTSTVTLGGKTYRTVRLSGLTWMAQNLDYKMEDSWYHRKVSSSDREKYGRLYTWEAAKKACESLGWRLPTDEEWHVLAMAQGGLWDGSNKGNPKKAYAELKEGGSSGFSALLGGGRGSDGSFNNLGSYGSYWSATKDGNDSAWIYEFNGFGGLTRAHYNKDLGFSCRCVQD